jgi:hypothetical protein
MDISSPEYRAFQQWKNKSGAVMCCVCQGPCNNEPACPCVMINWHQIVDGNYYRISNWPDDNGVWKVNVSLVGPVNFDYGAARIKEKEPPQPPTLAERLAIFKQNKRK